MAEMQVNLQTGEREFRVPFDALPAPFLFASGGELVLRTAPPEDTPKSFEIRFHPSGLEFQSKLPRLLAGVELAATPGEVSRAAALGQPVVSYAAGPAVLANIPEGLDSLDMIETFLETAPDIFAPEGYTFSGIAVVPPEDAAASRG
jgi:hypothetical protein